MSGRHRLVPLSFPGRSPRCSRVFHSGRPDQIRYTPIPLFLPEIRYLLWSLQPPTCGTIVHAVSDQDTPIIVNEDVNGLAAARGHCRDSVLVAPVDSGIRKCRDHAASRVDAAHSGGSVLSLLERIFDLEPPYLWNLWGAYRCYLGDPTRAPRYLTRFVNGGFFCYPARA